MKFQELSGSFGTNKRPLLTVNDCKAVFQPIVSVDKDQNIDIKAFEALAREVTPDGALNGPVRLLEDINQAEGHVDLYMHMLRESCEFITAAAESKSADFYVSVNADIPALGDEFFVEQTLDIISEYGISPESIAIEVIEDPFPRKTPSDPQRSNQAFVINSLSNLKGQGIKVGLDDFGTGSSNMKRFMQILSAVGGDALSFIKYDRIFTPSGSDISVPKAIIDLRSTDMPTLTNFLNFDLYSIVEGIETPDDQEVAQTVFADSPLLMQGFMFSKPLPFLQALQVLEDGIDYQIPLEESKSQGTVGLEYNMAT